MKKSDSSIHVTAEEGLPPFVETVHPITREPILLRDPGLMEVKHEATRIACDTAESFAAVVAAIAGTNLLVELHENGIFCYRDALGGMCTREATFGLKPHPTRDILCLHGPKVFDQRGLLKWHDQWPATLLPWDVEAGQEQAIADVTFAALSDFEVKGATAFQASVGETQVVINALRDEGPSKTNIPTYWRAVSPVFDQGAVAEVKLRYEAVIPKLKQDGTLEGDLRFKFELWSPDAAQVEGEAMDDAIARMAALLGDGFTIIRGSIG